MAESTAAEYLEKLFADSFKRELDQDENVVRSLPFFAAALALAVTLLGVAGGSLPPFDAGWWSFRFFALALVGLLAVGATWALGGILWYLFVAIRARGYIIPPREDSLIAWEKELRAFHEGTGLSGAALEQTIVTDIRKLMIGEYAKAAMAYRTNNIPKLFARTQALSRLITLLALAFLIVIVIFIDGHVTGRVTRNLGEPDASRAHFPADTATRATAPAQTGAAPEPVPDIGRPPAMGGREQAKGQSGAEAMTSQSSSNAPAPAASSPPPPPPSQTFRKSEPPGNLKK